MVGAVMQRSGRGRTKVAPTASIATPTAAAAATSPIFFVVDFGCLQAGVYIIIAISIIIIALLTTSTATPSATKAAAVHLLKHFGECGPCSSHCLLTPPR